ncbi:hypothetical protein [Polyangium spumosum]|uniref:EGF-like domain-containing protein n=1 Tax=Polyangium spumosum TaxID=889282 RepID=A0A6N7Q8E6_9BACT|nr:hypothetical protein [Polyangium spumosum]MRG97141.1 hypothetical protein [Polyangium spumosum]
MNPSKALRLFASSSFLLLLVAVGGCEDETLTACPPAPFRGEPKLACDFSEVCRYGTPRGLDVDNSVGESIYGPDFCNGLTCSCGEDGTLTCVQTLLACSPHIIPQCPAGAAEGSACTMDPNFGNRECAVPGPGADLSQGIINGEVCACDMPGPVWRCIPVSRTDL